MRHRCVINWGEADTVSEPDVESAHRRRRGPRSLLPNSRALLTLEVVIVMLFLVYHAILDIRQRPRVICFYFGQIDS
jgi:hypothetical protein